MKSADFPLNQIPLRSKIKGCLHDYHSFTLNLTGNNKFRGSLFGVFVYNTTVQIMGSLPRISMLNEGFMYPITTFYIHPHCKFNRTHLQFDGKKTFYFYTYNFMYQCVYEVNIDNLTKEKLKNQYGEESKEINNSNAYIPEEPVYSFSEIYPKLNPKAYVTLPKVFLSPKIEEMRNNHTKNKKVFKVKCKKGDVIVKVNIKSMDTIQNIVIQELFQDDDFVLFYNGKFVAPCDEEYQMEIELLLTENNNSSKTTFNRDFIYPFDRTYHTLYEAPNTKMETLLRKKAQQFLSYKSNPITRTKTKRETRKFSKTKQGHQHKEL